MLAGIADTELLVECTRRLPPARAARLMEQFAPPRPAA
jgi:hypothetical protein